VLEVKSGNYDRGQAARILMKNQHNDFILAAGDDKTDESLFQVLPDFACTIRIGLKPSIAKYNLSDFSLLLPLLKDLSQ
jgi:trehalose 6-phosphate synthase/phosphatase